MEPSVRNSRRIKRAVHESGLARRQLGFCELPFIRNPMANPANCHISPTLSTSLSAAQTMNIRRL